MDDFTKLNPADFVRRKLEDDDVWSRVNSQIRDMFQEEMDREAKRLMAYALCGDEAPLLGNIKYKCDKYLNHTGMHSKTEYDSYTQTPCVVKWGSIETATDVKGVPPEKQCWVALQLPHSDGSGKVEVVGIYSTREKAEAAAYRHIGENFVCSQPVKVVEYTIDEDRRL